MTHLRVRLPFATLALLGSTAIALSQSPAPTGLRAMDHVDVRTVSGSWDLEAASGRKCRVQLNPKGTRADLVLGMPTACKATFPRLAGATSWGLSDGGEIVMMGTARNELMRFRRMGEGPMEAGSGDERFTLASVTGRYPSAEKTQAIKAATGAASPAAQPATVPGFAPVRSASGQITNAARPIPTVAAPPAERLPGTYAILRYAGREVCRLVLDPKPATKPGQMQARFAGACTEAGMATFDPVAWKFDKGRLALVARKGHEVQMVYDLDGMWRKDPPSGATLLLNRVAP
ncbi:MAG: AprI/Inh family metalloprotease inhibitor [Bosea sp. (in: a-proteobacteria)]